MNASCSAVMAHVDAMSDRTIAIASRLLRYETVRPEGGPPDDLGDGLRECLRYAADQCVARGMAVRVHEGCVLVAELGAADENVAAVVHLDVVPAEGEWLYPPFSGTVADGYLWGRGAQDDKGALASLLAAVDAIIESGLQLRRRITLIIGTDEESGLWRDLEAFHRHEPMPTMAFVPDGDFPVVRAEKGFANFTVQIPAMGGVGEAARLESLTGGERVNVVPSSAEARLVGLDARYLTARAEAFMLSHPGACIEVAEDGPTVVVRARGVPAHASTPEKGRNALSDLAIFLAPETLERNAPEAGLRFIERLLGSYHHGERLGTFRHDEFMGPCTASLTIARTLDDGSEALRMNLRPVAGQTLKSIETAVAERARALGDELGAEYRVSLEDTSREPLCVPEDSELVQGLKAAYECATGRPGVCTSIGGTTFAKAFETAVAFGPVVCDEEEELAHQANERVSIDALLRNARIYAAALVELAAAV